VQSIPGWLPSSDILRSSAVSISTPSCVPSCGRARRCVHSTADASCYYRRRGPDRHRRQRKAPLPAPAPAHRLWTRQIPCADAVSKPHLRPIPRGRIPGWHCSSCLCKISPLGDAPARDEGFAGFDALFVQLDNSFPVRPHALRSTIRCAISATCLRKHYSAAALANGSLKQKTAPRWRFSAQMSPP